MRPPHRFYLRTLLLWLCCLIYVWPIGLSANAAESAIPDYSNEALLTQMLIVRADEQTLDNLPALAVTFSQAIDPNIDFDDFLTVTKNGKLVEGAWVLSQNNAYRLYFTHIEPDTSYRVQVRPGITAKNGLKLLKPGDFSVKTRDIQPAFDFATQGSILPARLTNGLPIRVVNVPELDIEFLRVQPDNLGDVLQAMRLDGGIKTWNLDRINKITDSVYSDRYVTDARRNARETLVMPVETIADLQQAGLYFAVMRRPGHFSDDAYKVTHFVVTNIGLHTRVYDKRLEVFTHALGSGKPLADVELKLHGKSQTVATSSNAQGQGSFAAQPQGPLFLTARLNDQFAFLDLREPALDLSDYAITGRADQVLAPFIYSMRDLYRPGEVMNWSILLRNRDGKVEPVQTLHLRLIRPDTKVLREETLKVATADLGYFAWRFKLPDDVPTGSWRLEVRLGKDDKTALQTTTFQVEEFLPERMQLSLQSDDDLVTRGEKWPVAVQGDYLYGTPAAGNKVEASRSLALARHPVADWPEFYFGNPADEQHLKREEYPELNLNEAGSGFLDMPPIPETIKSPLNIRLQASLFEVGGRTVDRVLQQPFWPAPQLVGIRPLFKDDTTARNTEAQFELIKVNAQGERVAAPNLSATLIREEYEYFWEYNEQEGWQRNEVRNEYPQQQLKTTLAAEETGQVAFPVGSGAYRLEVEDADTGLKTVYAFFAGWQSPDNVQANRPDQIELSLDKASYRGGDTVQLEVDAPAAGEAMLTVEGDELLWFERVQLPKGQSTHAIPVDQAWQRHDLYIAVTNFRPADSQAKIAPNRALGLIHLPLDRRDRELAINIEAPDKIRPEQTVQVKMQAENLRAAKAQVTLAAVDSGVLNITDYQTPKPHQFFFARHAYGVDLHDDYGKIIESVDGQALRQRFGGGVAASNTSLGAQAQIQIVSLFSDAVTFNEQGEATIELDIPSFDGQLRLMAVAFSDEQMGSAEHEMQVASPVVGSLSAPRFLASGDSSFLTVELRNISETEETVQMQVSGNDRLEFVKTDDNFTLAPDQRETLRVPFAARATTGVGRIKLRIEGADFVANRQLELQLRPPYPQVTRQFSYEVPAGGSALRVPADVADGLLAATLKARLTLSNTPPLPVSMAVDGLLQYPYGCLEQVTSSAYPYLFLEPKLSEQLGLPTLTMPERNERVQTAIMRLSGMQIYNGSFTLWGSHGSEEFWLTPYVTDFLLDARAQGFQVPEQLVQKALKNLEERLQEGYRYPSSRYNYSDDPEYLDLATRAYAAYVLAREKRAPLGTLRTIYKDEAEAAISGLPLVHLGLALSLQGDAERGKAAIARGLALQRDAEQYLGDYGSPVRDRAMMLYLLLRHRHTVPDLNLQVQSLAEAIYARRYLSTQEQVAVFQLGRLLEQSAREKWQATLQIADQEQTWQQSGSVTNDLSAADLRAGIQMSTTGERPLYANLSLSAYPSAALPPKTAPIHVERNWFDLEGKRVSLEAVKPGDLLLARLKVNSTERLRDALLVDLLPSGFELENSNLMQNDVLQTLKLEGMQQSVADLMAAKSLKHQAFRDDRYVAAFELDVKVNRYLFYLVRVVAPGRSMVPPPRVVDMYRPDLYGLGESAGVVQITDE